MDNLFFERMEYNSLFRLLQDEEFVSSLAYLVDNKTHTNLKVLANEYSIEISNTEVTIAIILFVGFEKDEFLDFMSKPNLHIITFSKVATEMNEFENMNVKYIDQLSWFFMIINLSENKKLSKLQTLKNLNL